MKSGQEVILRKCYRSGNENGGWRWQEHIAEIKLLWKRTAMVAYTDTYGRYVYERVHISRIRPIEETIKVNLKVQNLQLEVSGE